ncbi:MAG: septum formation initiator family protein [Deltaproteobacteria bacterium]|nr:septum formation initiator family protein [Deltaproteobacteria bacterium]
MAFIRKYFISIVILSFTGIIFFAVLKSGCVKYSELKKVQNEKEKYLTIIKQLEEKNKMLVSEIRRLREDKKYLESTARKELGLVKENEKIYRFKKGFVDGVDEGKSLE